MECIFCKIVNKEIPAEIFYEDEAFLAFLDINPQSPGHTQIIPKEHFRWVWDVPEDSGTAVRYSRYFLLVRRIARALQGTFGTDAVWMKVMGDEVPHAHVWLFPNPYESHGDKKAFEENARRIKEVL